VGAIMSEPTDIVILTHNRLDHLVEMVDALEARTKAPYRITIVDNASGPEVRNWLQANRERFHQLILREENLYPGSSGPALQIGIDATTSDPVVVTDPDLVVPERDPCWLTEMLGILERHPDFGILGIGLDQSNLPAVQEPENLRPEEIVDDEIVEQPVGSVFTFVRREALGSYYDDWRACQSVERAGYRFGWALNVRAFHLGWDDYKLHPGHLASKRRYGGPYLEVHLIPRAPSLHELAVAGPVIAETRRAGVPDAAVLELSWADTPPVAASVPGVLGLLSPEDADLSYVEGAAGAVLLVDPPRERAAELVAEACRVARGPVIAVAPLATFGARPADELSPAGWRGREQAGPGDVPLRLARSVEAHELGMTTLDDRERWLDVFARAAFGKSERRMWVWEPTEPEPVPDDVMVDLARVTPWEPVAPPPERRLRPLRERVLDRARQRRRIATEVVRARGLRRRRPAPQQR
jgi:glycosyl transferase family 2